MRRWAELDFVAHDGSPRRLPMADGAIGESRIWEQFAAATRGQGEPAVTAGSVLPTMQLLDAARQSSRRGVAVEINSATWPV